MIRRIATALAALVLLAACANSPAPGQATSPDLSPPPPATPSPEPTKADTATEMANRIKAKVKSVTKVVTITEDNDPNDLIGRPGGYTDGAIIYDSGVKCTELGNGCGGTIEIWPTTAEAKARSEYLRKVLKAAPMLGTEYHTLNGTALLRVTGKIKPSVAKIYAAAFTG